MPVEPYSMPSGPLVQASVGTTDEAGIISSAWPLRNPTYRPSQLNNRHKALQFPSLIPHTHYTHALPVKMAVAVQHLHLYTWYTAHPSICSSRAPAMGQHWIGLSTYRDKTRPWRPTWYGIVWYGAYSGICIVSGIHWKPAWTTRGMAAWPAVRQTSCSSSCE